jgi:hypothetical protein
MSRANFRRRWARRGFTPCDATVEGPFLGSNATELRCGDVAGHDGAHFFHVEWGGATPRWVDTMGCGHSDDPSFDGKWCGYCNPSLGGDAYNARQA